MYPKMLTLMAFILASFEAFVRLPVAKYFRGANPIPLISNEKKIEIKTRPWIRHRLGGKHSRHQGLTWKVYTLLFNIPRSPHIYSFSCFHFQVRTLPRSNGNLARSIGIIPAHGAFGAKLTKSGSHGSLDDSFPSLVSVLITIHPTSVKLMKYT